MTKKTRTFARFYVESVTHEKFVGLSHLAYRLYWQSVGWCRSRENNGEVPLAVLPTLVGGESRQKLRAAALELQAAVLWEQIGPDEWGIHDYCDHADDAAKIAQQRANKQAAAAASLLSRT